MTHTRRRRATRDRTELRVVLSGSAQLAGLRVRLRRLLHAHGQTKADTEAIVLATEEAANNALLAGRSGSCRVEVSVALVERFVCVEVRDNGLGVKGVCLDPGGLAGRDAEHGRGLHLMGALMESLEIVPRSRGTLVRMTKRLARRDEQAGKDADRLAS